MTAVLSILQQTLACFAVIGPGLSARCVSLRSRRRPAWSSPTCAFGCQRCCSALAQPCLSADSASQDSFRRVLRVVSPSVFCRRGCSGAQCHPGESAVMARGTADLQDRISGCPGSGGPAGAAGGSTAARGAGKRPDGVLPVFHTGHDRDAQGADATPQPLQARTGFAGGRDDLICGPRSDPPWALPFRRCRINSRTVPAAAAMPRALCAAGASLATRAARRCGPAPLLQAGPAWPLSPLAASAGTAAGSRREDCRRCAAPPQAASVSRPGSTVLHRRAFACRT